MTYPILLKLRNYGGSGMERLEEPEVVNNFKEMCFLDTNMSLQGYERMYKT